VEQEVQRALKDLKFNFIFHGHASLHEQKELDSRYCGKSPPQRTLSSQRIDCIYEDLIGP
jgi:hypothetical protein